MSNDKEPFETPSKKADEGALSRRNILLGTSTLVAAAALTSGAFAQVPRKLRPLRPHPPAASRTSW
jgi:hypothetical protein